MFALVTILAVLLGLLERELIRVQARHAWADRFEAGLNDGTSSDSGDRSTDRYRPCNFTLWQHWNGEDRINNMCETVFYEPWLETEVREFKALFPDTIVYLRRGGHTVEIR